MTKKEMYARDFLAKNSYNNVVETPQHLILIKYPIHPTIINDYGEEENVIVRVDKKTLEVTKSKVLFKEINKYHLVKQLGFTLTEVKDIVKVMQEIKNELLILRQLQCQLER